RADQPAGGPVPRVHRRPARHVRDARTARGAPGPPACRGHAERPGLGRGAPRANLLGSGATGSGKTTLLAALLSLVPHDERLVIVEEAGELAPAHPHGGGLLARHANVDGAGRVDLTDLVRHALRMRPDRIVLGECRGAEVREVLAAL